MDFTRREITVLGITSLSSLPGGLKRQIDSSENENPFTGVAFLFGTERPQPEFFEDKGIGIYLFETPNGEKHYTEPPYEEWIPLPTNLTEYTHNELPGDPIGGSLFFDESRGVPTWWDRDHYEWPTFVDDTLTTPVTVSNTTSRETLWNPTINADSLIEGRTYQVDLMGDFSTANNSDTFSVYATFGGADLAGISNVPANATDAPWSIEFTWTVRSHGQNGTLIAHTRGLFNSEPDDSDSSEQSIDTTTAVDLSFDVEWSAADAGNSVTLEQAHLKQMR